MAGGVRCCIELHGRAPLPCPGRCAADLAISVTFIAARLHVLVSQCAAFLLVINKFAHAELQNVLHWMQSDYTDIPLPGISLDDLKEFNDQVGALDPRGAWEGVERCGGQAAQGAPPPLPHGARSFSLFFLPSAPQIEEPLADPSTALTLDEVLGSIRKQRK